MPQDVNDFALLMSGWRAGSPDALRRLVAEYGGVIRAAVRRRLDRRVRRQFDSLDFVQDVWAAVATTPLGDQDFPNPEALVGFLTRVAYNKVIDTVERHVGTQKRDVTRERPLPWVIDERASGLIDPAQPTPSQCAIGEEVWAGLLHRFPEGQRPILEWLRAGYTHEEIAAATQVSVRTVERVVRRLRELCGAVPPTCHHLPLPPTT